MENELEDFLMDQFEGMGNEFDETIESFEITDTEIIIETWISWSMNISDYVDEIVEIEDLKISIEEDLLESETISYLGEDYVCGFYCHNVEDLTPADYLQNCDIQLRLETNIADIYLPMAYSLDRSEIETMYSIYKKSA
jgi:hypothetical protein